MNDLARPAIFRSSKAFQSDALLLFGHDATLDEEGTDIIAIQRIAVTNKRNVLRQLNQLNIIES